MTDKKGSTSVRVTGDAVEELNFLSSYARDNKLTNRNQPDIVAELIHKEFKKVTKNESKN